MRRAPDSVSPPPAVAVSFATDIADGFPPDVVRARECVDAHIALDRRVVDMGAEDAYSRIARLIWGGEEGRDFAEQVLAEPTLSSRAPVRNEPEQAQPEPALVAADLDDEESELHDLCVKLNRIDDRTRDQILAATRLAYLTALRALTRQARGAVLATMKKPWRETVGREVIDARENSRALYRHAESPYIAAQFITEPVMAALTIDQEGAIRDAIEDLELTAGEILTNAHDDIIAALAQELDTTEAEIRAELADDMERQRDASTGLLVAAMTAFTLSRADRTDGQVTEALEAAVIPAAIVNDTVAVAGGAVRNGASVARTADGLIELVGGTNTEVESPYSSWLYRTTARVLGAVPVVTMEWYYGSPSERDRPRVDHQRLDGLTWTGRSALRDELDGLEGIVGDDVAPDVWPGSLPGCKCRARPVGLGIPSSVES